MRTILAAAALAAAAFSAPASASADGCVTTLLQSDDRRYAIVTVHPDGSITINPNEARAFASTQVARATWLVGCIV